MIMSRKGGPRTRVMGDGDRSFNPEMSKYPLFFPRPGDVMYNPHCIVPIAENFASKCTIGILHYKFLPGFIEKVRRAVAEGNYWNNSSEYRVYLNKLSEEPETGFEYEGSVRYTTPADLVGNAVISPVDWGHLSPDYLDLARRQGRQSMLSAKLG